VASGGRERVAGGERRGVIPEVVPPAAGGRAKGAAPGAGA